MLCSERDLKDIGIPLGPRKKIMNFVKKWKVVRYSSVWKSSMAYGRSSCGFAWIACGFLSTPIWSSQRGQKESIGFNQNVLTLSSWITNSTPELEVDMQLIPQVLVWEVLMNIRPPPLVRWIINILMLALDR